VGYNWAKTPVIYKLGPEAQLHQADREFQPYTCGILDFIVPSQQFWTRLSSFLSFTS
jgi:hypothetical protein